MTEAPIGRREESHRRCWRVAEQIADVADIAEAIMHLEAVPFVTGEVLHLDGASNAGF
jgi:hypothetical protein